MKTVESDRVFAGSIPKLYESHLVPLIFQPYAADLVNRLPPRPRARVLEVAAGTGVVTRALATMTPQRLDRRHGPEPGGCAQSIGTSRPVEWPGRRDELPLTMPNSTPSCASSA